MCVNFPDHALPKNETNLLMIRIYGALRSSSVFTFFAPHPQLSMQQFRYTSYVVYKFRSNLPAATQSLLVKPMCNHSRYFFTWDIVPHDKHNMCFSTSKLKMLFTTHLSYGRHFSSVWDVGRTWPSQQGEWISSHINTKTPPHHILPSETEPAIINLHKAILPRLTVNAFSI
jgi:hypothetical protein